MRNQPPLWTRHAQHWSRVRAPLRPVEQDLQWAQQVVDAVCTSSTNSPRKNALLLGMTPELCNLQWPPQTRLIAADSSLPMIQGLWRDRSQPHNRHDWAVQSLWTSLPLPDQSCDLVIGDGCFVLLSGEDPANLVRSLHRVLKPNGKLHLRVFIRPDRRELPEDLWREMEAGRVGNFHIFKFRLLASLCDAKSEVPVAEAHRYFSERCPDPGKLASQLGWPLDEIRTIDAYCNQPAVYWFPTCDQFRMTISAAFEVTDCQWPEYEMGDRCPSFNLSPRRVS